MITSRRRALTLAAVLAATVLTGGAAILGIARTPPQPQVTPIAMVQTAQTSPQHWQEAD
jgi:hypothetical protein